MFDLIEKAKNIFTSDEDRKTLEEQAEYVQKLEDVKQLMDSDGGAVIKDWIKDELKMIIDNLNEKTAADPDRESLLSDMKAYFKILNKLNVQADLDAVKEWIQGQLEE